MTIGFIGRGVAAKAGAQAMVAGVALLVGVQLGAGPACAQTPGDGYTYLYCKGDQTTDGYPQKTPVEATFRVGQGSWSRWGGKWSSMCGGSGVSCSLKGDPFTRTEDASTETLSVGARMWTRSIKELGHEKRVNGTCKKTVEPKGFN